METTEKRNYPLIKGETLEEDLLILLDFFSAVDEDVDEIANSVENQLNSIGSSSNRISSAFDPNNVQRGNKDHVYILVKHNNCPTNNVYYHIRTQWYRNTENCAQIAISYNGNRAISYVRHKYSNNWSSWQINGVPIGTIVQWVGSTPPTGYLECNGATISRTTYKNLFDAIGTRFGNGNGSSTFKIPDLRGMFLRGWDHGRGVDSGRNLGTYQGDMFKSHHHGVKAQPNTTSGRGGLYDAKAGSSNTTTNTGGSETRPKNIAVMFCIKY